MAEEEERGEGEEKLQYSLKAPWERNEAREPTTHAEDDWEEGLARLREYQALHGHACPRTKWGGSGHKKRSALHESAGRFANNQRKRFKVPHCVATSLKPSLLSRLRGFRPCPPDSLPPLSLPAYHLCDTHSFHLSAGGDADEGAGGKAARHGLHLRRQAGAGCAGADDAR